MTGKTFRFQVIGTIVLALCLSILSLALSCYASEKHYQAALRSGPTVFIPIGAGWLAFCVQRRVAFTKALFDVWQKIVVTIQDAVQYTHLTSPTQADFAKVMHSLSCRIDDLRGVFRNPGEGQPRLSEESKSFVLSVKQAKSLEDVIAALKKLPKRTEIGLYPFESLKQIHGTVSSLGFGSAVTAPQASTARSTILALWGILRGELLKELDRDFPEYPDTPYHS
ncbi:hypothetical protein PMI42_05674 [Bradyrhizobium sp. YR681]|uniref:hypothetical protein n=1 Tax=Bradyrhizobium sp. YR681 TaxID=1144344 RepID=UPI00027141BA|nr:hypothetical protein [Bradyrhizobium sp. YR681]EJN11051.1 hypothetical protein PMI42_05674 [Bradyrhizobium sp. YR681]